MSFFQGLIISLRVVITNQLFVTNATKLVKILHICYFVNSFCSTFNIKYIDNVRVIVNIKIFIHNLCALCVLIQVNKTS